MKYLLMVAIGLLSGFGGAAIFNYSGLGHAQTHDYLVANPEILPEMAEAYQTKQSRERLASVAGPVTAPFDGAVLGNPNGSKTLVKFTDYACGYCRASVDDVDRLIAADPDLRVVIREWPIFDGSEQAARMALAAARQGKYPAFYHALFEQGPPSDTTIARAAQIAGLDIEQARAFAASDDATGELARNMALARTLQFTGTPSWVAGGETIQGLVPPERLAEALAADS